MKRKAKPRTWKGIGWATSVHGAFKMGAPINGMSVPLIGWSRLRHDDIPVRVLVTEIRPPRRAGQRARRGR